MPKSHRQFESREQTHPFYTTLPESLRNAYSQQNSGGGGEQSAIRVSTLPRLYTEQKSGDFPVVNTQKIGTYRIAARYPATSMSNSLINGSPPTGAEMMENGHTRPVSSISGRVVRASPVEIVNDHHIHNHHNLRYTPVAGGGPATTNTTTTSSGSGSSQIGSIGGTVLPPADTTVIPTTLHDDELSQSATTKQNGENKTPTSFYGLWSQARRPRPRHRPTNSDDAEEEQHTVVMQTHDEDERKSSPKGFWLSFLQAAILACLILLALALVGLIVGLAVGARCRSSRNSSTGYGAIPGAIYDPNDDSNDTANSQSNDNDPILAALFAEDAANGKRRNDNNKVLRDIRLPDTVVPIHYKLELAPQLVTPLFRFDGHVEIDMRVKRETRELILHASRQLQVNTGDVRLIQLMPQSSTISPTSTITIISNATDTINSTVIQIQQTASTTTQSPPAVNVIDIERVELDAAREFLRLHLRQPLQPALEYRLYLTFSGNLTDDLKGIYRSSYKNGDGKVIWLMASQMQPTDARKVFPLFDEPALKATFQVTIVHDARFSSIANMELIRQEPRDDGLVADVYNTSVPMSSYLLAFVVSDFKYREAVSERGTRLRVWARPNALQQTEYAMEFTKKVLNYFEDYFQIPFPLSKLDQIAVPDFSAGAMENWGLIVYRETALLFDPQTGSVNNKQRIATVIAHELAHQWFGNLVSPKWWDDLWLNEGFASYLEYVGQDYAHPDWKVMQQFVANDLQQTLKADALVTSHPISLPVYNPDEISEIFDSISYGKGAALIRMMRYFLGEDAMRRGLSQYLRNFTYDAATQDGKPRVLLTGHKQLFAALTLCCVDHKMRPKYSQKSKLILLGNDKAFLPIQKFDETISDLWWHLTQAAQDAGLRNVDVKGIMDSWTLQMGYPVVTISRPATAAASDGEPAGNNQKNEISVSQQHFLINPMAKVLLASPYNYTWHLPLTLVTQKNADFREFERSGHERVKWMTTKNMTITDIYADDSEWLLGNILETGFYRVNYDEKNWYLLSRQLKQGRNEIHVINRAQLVDDALALAQASLLSYNVALDVVDYLIKEQEYLPWEAAFASFNYIDDMMRSTADYGLMQKYMLKQLQPIFMSLGWSEDPNDSILTQKLRVDVISAACYYGLDECIHNAKRQFRAWMADPVHNPIANNLKTAVYCTAIREGNVHEWNFAWNEYKISNVASEQTKLLYALSCSKEPWILSRYLQQALEETDIKRQDASKVISYVAGSAVGKYLAWPFFVNNYDKLRDRFGSSFFSFASIIKELTEDINSEYGYNELKDFVKVHRNELSTGKRAFKQAIERAEANLRWTSKNVDTITAWLKKNVGSEQ